MDDNNKSQSVGSSQGNDPLTGIAVLPSAIQGAVEAFVRGLRAELGRNLQSITVVGSSLTEDYQPGRSDINTVLMLEQRTLAVLNTLAAVEKSWSDIDSNLQRRLDLIPQLVNTVKGYAGHEKELFENIAQSREKYFQAGSVADKAQASNELSGFLSRLLVLQERYPDLKANQNFRDLQAALEGTENRINVARTRYNESARQLNTYAREFMGSFFCRRAGVEKADYFEATEQAKTEVPQVQF